MRALIVKFKDKEFELTEDGKVREVSGEREDVVVLPALDYNAIRELQGKGVKVFICDKDELTCLSLIANAVFKRPKACKFS